MSTNNLDQKTRNIKNDASTENKSFWEWLIQERNDLERRGNDIFSTVDQFKYIGNGISEKVIPKISNFDPNGTYGKLLTKFKPSISWLSVPHIHK